MSTATMLHTVYHGDFEDYQGAAKFWDCQYDIDQDAYKRQRASLLPVYFPAEDKIVFAASGSVVGDGIPVLLCESWRSGEFLFHHAEEWNWPRSIGDGLKHWTGWDAENNVPVLEPFLTRHCLRMRTTEVQESWLEAWQYIEDHRVRTIETRCTACGAVMYLSIRPGERISIAPSSCSRCPDSARKNLDDNAFLAGRQSVAEIFKGMYR
jgi:hypothetical protein